MTVRDSDALRRDGPFVGAASSPATPTCCGLRPGRRRRARSRRAAHRRAGSRRPCRRRRLCRRCCASRPRDRRRRLRAAALPAAAAASFRLLAFRLGLGGPAGRARSLSIGCASFSQRGEAPRSGRGRRGRGALGGARPSPSIASLRRPAHSPEPCSGARRARAWFSLAWGGAGSAPGAAGRAGRRASAESDSDSDSARRWARGGPSLRACDGARGGDGREAAWGWAMSERRVLAWRSGRGHWTYEERRWRSPSVVGRVRRGPGKTRARAAAGGRERGSASRRRGAGPGGDGRGAAGHDGRGREGRGRRRRRRRPEEGLARVVVEEDDRRRWRVPGLPVAAGPAKLRAQKRTPALPVRPLRPRAHGLARGAARAPRRAEGASRARAGAAAGDGGSATKVDDSSVISVGTLRERLETSRDDASETARETRTRRSSDPAAGVRAGPRAAQRQDRRRQLARRRPRTPPASGPGTGTGSPRTAAPAAAPRRRCASPRRGKASGPAAARFGRRRPLPLRLGALVVAVAAVGPVASGSARRAADTRATSAGRSTRPRGPLPPRARAASPGQAVSPSRRSVLRAQYLRLAARADGAGRATGPSSVPAPGGGDDAAHAQ